MANGECSTVRCDSPTLLDEPAAQGAEAQAYVEASTETPREEPESPGANGTPRPHGEDAQMQTDFTPLPESPRHDPRYRGPPQG